MRYDSPFIKFLEAIANLLIVTFLWFVFSLPILTVVASSAALYHCTVKVIFGEKKGNGVFRDFFDSYKQNLIPGIKLSLIVIIAMLFIAEGLWT
ncbi:MAG: YesL family protein, partial [Erysipelotrichaceae bacterium]|nr:YesL family protein [Erysipelotrichaceae bacterium]